MTFTEIVAAITTRLNIKSPDAVVRVGEEVNRYYRRITTSVGIQPSRRIAALVGTTTVGTPLVTFISVEKILRVYDDSTGSVREIKEVPWNDLRIRNTGEGNATQYAVQSTTSTSVTIRLNANATEEMILKADGYSTTGTLSGSMEPNFPESYHDMLVYGVLKDEYSRREKTEQVKEYKAEYEQRLSDLRMWHAKNLRMKNRQGDAFTPSLASVLGGSGSASGGGSGITGDDNGALFNVMDYGGVGDGVADDGVAIQLTINAAIANGAGRVYLPSPIDNYRLGTPLTLPNGTVDIRLEGEGFKGGCDLVYSGAGTAITIGASGARTEGFVMKDIRVDCSAAAAGANGIRFVQCVSWNLENVEVKGRTDGTTLGTGIAIDGGNDSTHNATWDQVFVRGDWAVAYDFIGVVGSINTCNNYHLGLVGATRNTSKPGTGTIGFRYGRYCGDCFFGHTNVEDYDTGYYIDGRYARGFVRAEACTKLLEWGPNSINNDLFSSLFADVGETVVTNNSSDGANSLRQSVTENHIQNNTDYIHRIGGNIYDENVTLEIKAGSSIGAGKIAALKFMNKAGTRLFTWQKPVDDTFELRDLVNNIRRFKIASAVDDDTVINAAGTGAIDLQTDGTRRLRVLSTGLRVPNTNTIGFDKAAASEGAYIQMTAGDNFSVKNNTTDKALILETVGPASLINAAVNGNSVMTLDATKLSLLLGQLKFPASQVASADANTLDDYEEGTWTPTDGSGASLSLSPGTSTYIKIGQLVIAQFSLTYPSTVNGSNSRISGLPFTCASVSGFSVCFGFINYSATGIQGVVNSGATTFDFWKASGSHLLNSDLTDRALQGTIIYRANA